MKFSRKTLLIAVFAVGTFLTHVNDADACRGRSGGGGGGYSGGYSGGRSSYGGSSYGRSSYGYSSHNTYRPVQVIRPVQPVQHFTAPPPPVQPPVVQQPVSQPQQVTQAPPTPAAPQQQVQTTAPTQDNAQMSALQALGGFAPPQVAAKPQATAPAHVGTWSANLGNGASVRLTLNADESFTWSATNKNGSASSFSGNYTIANGSLTLIRSNDNQKLGGTMNTSGSNAFSFKVAGNNAAALNFSR